MNVPFGGGVDEAVRAVQIGGVEDNRPEALELR